MHERSSGFAPDFGQFLKVLRRERPDRPVLYEHYIEWPILREALGDDFLPQDDPPWGWCWNTANGFARLGYDTAPLHLSLLQSFRFREPQEAHGRTISQNEGAPIGTLADAEGYAWPDPDAFEYERFLDGVAQGVPDGMRLILYAPRGIYESLVDLLGFERLSVLFFEETDLVRRVAEEVGQRTLRYLERAIAHPVVGAFLVCDDLGFKTSTFASPGTLREFVLPWHRRMVELAHRAGKPAILHSCGQVAGIMDDIIDDCGFDAKHSFEDVIEPVEQIHARYGHRIAILGGLDVDYLSRSTPEEIYRRARKLIETTECRGYALGSGNSLTDEMPRENLRALWRAAAEARRNA